MADNHDGSVSGRVKSFLIQNEEFNDVTKRKPAEAGVFKS